jgi:hypothetical protein
MNVKEIEGLYGVTSRRCPRTYGIQYSSQKRTCVLYIIDCITKRYWGMKGGWIPLTIYQKIQRLDKRFWNDRNVGELSTRVSEAIFKIIETSCHVDHRFFFLVIFYTPHHTNPLHLCCKHTLQNSQILKKKASFSINTSQWVSSFPIVASNPITGIPTTCTHPQQDYNEYYPYEDFERQYINWRFWRRWTTCAQTQDYKKEKEQRRKGYPERRWWWRWYPSRKF